MDDLIRSYAIRYLSINYQNQISMIVSYPVSKMKDFFYHNEILKSNLKLKKEFISLLIQIL